MNLSDYFNPVELDKPGISTHLGESVFYKNIYTHTANTLIHNLKGIDLIILGIGEDRNAVIPGSANAPDAIRNKLYQLAKIKKINIADLGNFKVGKKVNDTYIGFAEVISYLILQKVNILILGGSNDLVYPLVKNDVHIQKEVELTTIDARINFEKDAEKHNSENYLNKIFESLGEQKLFYNNIGNQQFLNDADVMTHLESKLCNLHRLGAVKSSLMKYEPVLRNSDIVALDICALKQSDAQGQYNPSPNGFAGDEVCQLAWYAGLSDKTSIFGIFEVIPDLDFNEMTAGASAQIAWHFIYGVANRYHEFPGVDKNFKKFIIGLETYDSNISFYRSELSDRWWMEITNSSPGFEKIFVPCNKEDYDMACNHEIPDVWWKACQRYNIVK